MTSLAEKSTFRTVGGDRLTEAQSITWKEMGQGVWVAKRGKEFMGLIEELWGAGYRVTDRNGAIVGEFATYESARRRIA
ncbi:hypothetical protein [Salinibacterium sp. GXW1014]|uniref:hypothetical protein n=1 Tax=Salinibacterium sp. GXW1014 TaxID=3377838 RepID=UPI00383A720B